MAFEAPDPRRQHVLALLAREEWERAKCECRDALAADGNDGGAKATLISILLRQHRWSEARILRDGVLLPLPTSAESALESAHIELRTSGASAALALLRPLADNAMTRLAHGTFTNNMAESQRSPLALTKRTGSR